MAEDPWLQEQLRELEGLLPEPSALLGDEAFTALEAYLFLLSCCAQQAGADLSPYPRLAALRERGAARPAVLAAMRAQGLLK